LYSSQNLPGFDPVGDIHVELTDITARASIDDRILNRLGSRGQRQTRFGSRHGTNHINLRRSALDFLCSRNQLPIIAYARNHADCEQDKKHHADSNCGIEACSRIATLTLPPPCKGAGKIGIHARLYNCSLALWERVRAWPRPDPGVRATFTP